MKLVWAALGLLLGAVMPVQAGINAVLRAHLGDPLLAALVNFMVGGAALLLAWLTFGQPIGQPMAQAVSAAPWWAWVGGCLGAFLVAVSVVLAPILGATSLFTLAICGQLLASLALDHYGVLGYRADPLSLRKATGVALVAAGAWLVVVKR